MVYTYFFKVCLHVPKKIVQRTDDKKTASEWKLTHNITFFFFKLIIKSENIWTNFIIIYTVSVIYLSPAVSVTCEGDIELHNIFFFLIISLYIDNGVARNFIRGASVHFFPNLKCCWN